MSKTYSMGFVREDGDFQIIATLNNNDELIFEDNFEIIKSNLLMDLNQRYSGEIICVSRQDTPDYVSLEEPCSIKQQ